jgi:hypothetical protein
VHCSASGLTVDCHSEYNFEKSNHLVDLTVEGRLMLIFMFSDRMLGDRSSWAAFAEFNLLILFFFNFSFQVSAFTDDLRAI